MTCSRAILFLLLLASGFARGQGSSAYEENRRLEELALERARRMSALKEQALYEPPPRDLNPPPPAPASLVSSQMIQRQPEPFYFRVVTPDGLVPLDEWKRQQEQARVAAASPPPPPVAPQPRSVRLAFLSIGSSGERAAGESGRAEPLTDGPAPAVAKVGKPAAPAENDPVGGTVAVMEELPATEPGGQPKHRLLGFLSGKGLEEALEATDAEGGESGPVGTGKVMDRLAQRMKAPGTGQIGSGTKRTSPAESEGLLPEEDLEKPIASTGSAEFWNGFGQWLASARVPKSGGSGTVGPITAEGGQFEATHADFFTITSPGAPFHVIDDRQGETQLVELDPGTVGRNHGEGEEWAWMQLDSGLMGLMNKRHLRPSLSGEVTTFLASETSGRGPSLAVKKPRAVQYVEVDLPELPSEAGDGSAPLGGGLFPMAAAGADQPEPSAPAGETMTAGEETRPEPAPPATGTATLPADIPSLP